MGNLLAAFKGLVTAPGYLVRDEASCVIAENVSHAFPGRIRPRGGFGRFANGTTGRPMKLLSSTALGSALLVNTASTAAPGEADALEIGTGSGAFAALPTIDGSTVENIREERAAMALCRRDHYITSTNGVRRLDAGMGTLRFAGMPRGPGVDVYDMDAAVYAVLAAGTMLPDGWARAYRVTWHRYEPDKTLLGGAPTGRVVIRNVAGTSGYAAATTANVTLRIPLPVEFGTLSTALTATYFWRLWASKTWDTATGFGDDECYLVDEQYIDATDIANGYAVVTDATPDAYLQGSQPLHTNAIVYPVSDEGIRQGVVNADDPPPVATDVAYHANVLWYSKCRLRTRQNLTLKAVGGAGFVVGDTVTVTGPSGAVVFTGVVGAPGAATEFMVELGLATTEENIEATARNLVACIQRNSADWGGSAYHVSLNTSEPGLFFIEVHRGVDLTLSFATSRPAAFFIDEVDARSRPNRLFFSKPERGDAVPPINFLDVGPETTEVLRISPFRDRLIVWTNRGLYQVTGNTFADFAVSGFDDTTKLVARETVAAVDDRLYALCSSGVVEVSDGGVSVVSLPIDDFFQSKMTDSVELLRFRLLAFAVGDQPNHEYRLWLDTQTGGPGCETWLTFDTRTRAWSSGFFNYSIGGARYEARNCGVVLPDGIVVLGGEDPLQVSVVGRYFFSRPTYSDVMYDGTEVGLAARLRFTYQAPNGEGLMHWQQTIVKYEQLPTAPATVTFYPDENTPTGSSVAISNAVSRLEERVEVPWGARRTTRMGVEYVPAVTVPGPTSPTWDLAGIEVSYSSPTRFGRKTP